MQPFGMSSAQPTLVHSGSAPTDAAGGTTSDNSNITRQGRHTSKSIAAIIRRRPWKTTRPSTTGHSNTSQPPPTSTSKSKARSPPTESGVDAISSPDSAIPNVPETVPATGAVPDRLVDAWNVVKDEPKIANTRHVLDTVGVCQRLHRFSAMR